MSDFFRDCIITPIVAWIEQEFPDMPVVVLNQNVERPDEDYFGLQLITPVVKPGSRDDVVHKTGTETTFTITGQRNLTVSISAYLVKNDGNRKIHDDMYVPHGRLKLLQDSVEDPSRMEVLRKAGLAVWDAGDNLDIPEAVETGFESRASMDVVMGFTSSRDADLGAIEKAEFTATANGQEEPPVTVEDS